MRAVVELKRDVDPMRVLAYLYKYSDLQVTFGVNMVAIVGGKPKQLSLKELIASYIEYQKRVVTRRTEYELKQAKARAHVLEGLMIALDNLDEVIALIRASKSPKEARIGLIGRSHRPYPGQQEPEGSPHRPHGAFRPHGDPGPGNSGHAPAAPHQSGD